jgi:hypothetical protein
MYDRRAGQSLLGIVLGGLLIFVAMVFAFGWVGSGGMAKAPRSLGDTSAINTPA